LVNASLHTLKIFHPPKRLTSLTGGGKINDPSGDKQERWGMPTANTTDPAWRQAVRANK